MHATGRSNRVEAGVVEDEWSGMGSRAPECGDTNAAGGTKHVEQGVQRRMCGGDGVTNGGGATNRGEARAAEAYGEGAERRMRARGGVGRRVVALVALVAAVRDGGGCWIWVAEAARREGGVAGGELAARGAARARGVRGERGGGDGQKGTAGREWPRRGRDVTSSGEGCGVGARLQWHGAGRSA